MDTALKMNKEARVELVTTWRSEYAKTHSRARKSWIIDFIMESTGYKDRKTVIRLLKHGWKEGQKKRRGRGKKLGREERVLLGEIWLKMSQPCGKRMVVQLPEMLPYLEAEMGIRPEQREKLLSISAATIDRELRSIKLQTRKREK